MHNITVWRPTVPLAAAVFLVGCKYSEGGRQFDILVVLNDSQQPSVAVRRTCLLMLTFDCACSVPRLNVRHLARQAHQLGVKALNAVRRPSPSHP